MACDVPHHLPAGNGGVKVPALWKPSVGRCMRCEEVLCNLSLKCQSPLFLPGRKEVAERLRAYSLTMLPSRKAPEWALLKAERLAELVRSQQKGRKSQRPQGTSQDRTAGHRQAWARGDTDSMHSPILAISLPGLHRAFLDLKFFEALYHIKF